MKDCWPLLGELCLRHRSNQFQHPGRENQRFDSLKVPERAFLHAPSSLKLCLRLHSVHIRAWQVSAVLQARSAEGLSKISIWTETVPCQCIYCGCVDAAFLAAFFATELVAHCQVSMGVQLAYNVVRQTPLTTYAEIDARNQLYKERHVSW